MSPPPSFVAPIPVLARPPRPQNTSPLRASAAPPPPPDASSGGAPPSPDAGARAALERSLGVDLAASSSGQCACIWCAGSGKRTCAWCKGAGHRAEFVNKSWQEMTTEVERAIKTDEPVKLPDSVPTVCSACSGTCLLRCSKCRGSGIGSYGMGYQK